nr:uncharacterized protein si:ch211-203k16.3 isoform X2 [Syngnathus scovelli]
MRRAEPPARGSPLWALLLLLSGATAEQLNASGQHGGGSQCGDYTNQPTEDGMCRLVATLPQLDGQRCPDMFRCTDEVSYWLRQNEERKQQVAELKETVRQLHEELRDHRHRIRHFELLQHDDGSHSNAAQERRFHQMEVHYAEATSLLHLQGTLILNLQNQVHNLSRLVEQAKKRPGCLINAVRPNPLMNSQWALHPEIQHMRNCPIDCASIYYNGVTRSGVYTVVPALAALPVEVYCDMDTDGESRVRPRHQMRWRKTMTRRRLDSHPEAGGRLRQLRPRLARIPGRFRRPALRVLAGQRPHPRAERPRGLQLANRSGGLEQQAQARPLSTLQCRWAIHQDPTQRFAKKNCTKDPSERLGKDTHDYKQFGRVRVVRVAQRRRRGAPLPSARVGLRRQRARLFRLVPRQARLQHARQRRHLRRDLPRWMVVQPVLLRQPQWRLLQGRPLRPQRSAGPRRDRVALVERLRLLLSTQSHHDDPAARLSKTSVSLSDRYHGDGPTLHSWTFCT